MSSLSFSLLFLAVLLAASLVRIWLASRQIRHVSKHRDQVPAAFVGKISLEAHQKAADYTVARNRLVTIDVLISAAVVMGFTVFGGLQWLNGVLSQWLPAAAGSSALPRQLALVVLVTFISGIIDIPLDWFRQFRLEERFGFNRMTVRDWIKDMLKGSLLGAVIGLPIAAIIFWLMGQAGTYWWLWAWAIWTGFSLMLMLLAPTVIAPMFNKFSPLPEGDLKERLNALLGRCGFKVQGLYVMDGSKRSAHANAYFTGIGASKRIVLYDTLITQLGPKELEAVLAHEIGHYQHKHIRKRLFSTIAFSLVGFALLGWLASQGWFYQGLGVTPQDEHRAALALLLFFFALPPFMFFVSPLLSRLSRHHEFQADAYAAQQTGASAMIQALLTIYQDNAATLTPDPLHSAFYDSHPNAADRIGHLQAKGA
jgi:STE24 endopeptidase